MAGELLGAGPPHKNVHSARPGKAKRRVLHRLNLQHLQSRLQLQRPLEQRAWPPRRDVEDPDLATQGLPFFAEQQGWADPRQRQVCTLQKSQDGLVLHFCQVQPRAH